MTDEHNLITIEIDPEIPPTTQFESNVFTDTNHAPYIHQKEGIEAIMNGESVICTVGTGGGKRDIFQLGMINWLKQQEDARHGFFYSLYPTYALLNQHHELLNNRFNAMKLPAQSGVVTGKVKNLLRALGETQPIKSDEEEKIGFIPSLGVVGTVDKWVYLHYPNRNNKTYKAEFFYRQLYAPKAFDEVHILHPLALQNVVLNLERERLILETLDGVPPKIPHGFFSATTPDYAIDLLKTRKIVNRVVSGIGRHSRLKIFIHSPQKEHHNYLKNLIHSELANNNQIIVILNSRRRAYQLANQLSRKGAPYDLFRVFNGWNEYRNIKNAQKSKVLVIATSSAEVGVSDQFQVLITESCPAPNLIQRIGRVGRYGEEEAKIHILPAPYKGEIWYHTIVNSLPASSFRGINPFYEYLKKMDLEIPGNVFHATNSELLFALHYLLNELWERITLLPLELNKRMFDGSPYSKETNMPTISEAKSIFEKYEPFVKTLLLQAMTLRTTLPQIYYRSKDGGKRFSDNPIYALRTVSEHMVIDETAMIQGFFKPEWPVFDLGTLPFKYGQAIYMKPMQQISAKFDKDDKYAEQWRQFREQWAIKQLKGIGPLATVSLRFGKVVFIATDGTASPVPIVYDSEKKPPVGFLSFGLTFRLNSGKNREHLEEFLSLYPDSMFIHLIGWNKIIIGVETSFGAALNLFNQMKSDLATKKWR
ncbi:MAG: DEAD/DEAH box helicase [Methanobacteriota archaeon]|nr:MAG: DEAD/DEAH box helicase [Euryarchaeota archaeon]